MGRDACTRVLNLDRGILEFRKRKNEVPGDRRRVLILDDDPDNREVLRNSLTRFGMEVHTHSDADAVMDAALEDQYDLIVTSYVMQDWQGLSLVRNLREKGKETPAVMITGSFHPGVFRQAKNVGISYVLAKPFNPEDVARVIGKLLKDEQAASAAGGRGTSNRPDTQVNWL